MSPNNYSDARQAVINGEVNLIDIVRSFLTAIKDLEHLNIYVEVYEEEALERARLLQTQYEQNPSSIGALWGMVISIKDVICYKNHIVTAGSRMLTNFESQITATPVQRALDAGAIIIGRTNCDEFAMGSTNETSVYGPTYNGVDPTRVPGGSSGGAAVAVQMNTCHLSMGSDTGGSVRQPAAYCGVIGIKPTYGRISRYGLIAYASSFDQIGLIGHGIEDLALFLSTVSGMDPKDSTSFDLPVNLSKVQQNQKKYKIAGFKEVFDDSNLNPHVKAGCDLTISRLRALGHEYNTVSFDLLPYLVPTYYVLTTAEASSNLSRYDGIRYGYSSKDSSDIKSLYFKTRSEGFGIEVKRRLMMGTFVLSVGYFDAYFTKAQQVRQMIKNRIDSILEEYDMILLPTTTDIAPFIGSLSKDPIQMYLSDVFTVLANICGLPAISIPVKDDHPSHTMPLGIQLIGRELAEEDLLSLSHQLL